MTFHIRARSLSGRPRMVSSDCARRSVEEPARRRVGQRRQPHPDQVDSGTDRCRWRHITADENETVGYNVVPTTSGRSGRRSSSGDFNARDTATTMPVAIVNEAFARYFFGDRSPLGRHVTSVQVTMEIHGVAMRSIRICERSSSGRAYPLDPASSS